MLPQIAKVALPTLIIALAVFGLSKINTNNINPPKEEITYETKAVKEETETYEVDVKYPVFKIPSDSSAQTLLNETIQKAVYPHIEDLKEVAEEDFKEGFKSSVEITYEIPRFDEKIISLEFVISIYNAGTAHPNYTITTINYSLVKKKVLELNDIFKAGSDYSTRLSNLAFDDLKKSDINEDEEWIRKGTAFTKENYHAFRPDKDKLTFIFDPYQVASYAAGFISVDIPYEQIKDILQYDLVAHKKSGEEIMIEKDLAMQLNPKNEAGFKIEIKKISGNFAKGGASMDTGGFEWIAVKKDGKWSKIWAGQDVPECSEMNAYKVPQEIYQECESN